MRNFYVFYCEINKYKKTWRCFVCRHIMSLQIDAFMLLCVTFVHVTYNYFCLIYFYYVLLLVLFITLTYSSHIFAHQFNTTSSLHNPKDVNYSLFLSLFSSPCPWSNNIPLGSSLLFVRRIYMFNKICNFILLCTHILHRIHWWIRIEPDDVIRFFSYDLN